MTKESDMKPHGLSEEQLTHYREEGFVDVPGLFDREDLRAAEDAIEELTTRAVNDPANLAEVLELEPELVDGRRIPRRLYNPFLAHEGFRSIAGDLAEAGYVFSHWTGDAVGSENPLSLIIDSGKNVAANFIPEEAAEYLAVAVAADLGLVPLADVTSDPGQFGLLTLEDVTSNPDQFGLYT
ncbi:MAG: hypothetical protein GY871_09785, partial [Actinomycetales bacterium]|nr:hypothetical protein [Actinomycetales bacterium]